MPTAYDRLVRWRDVGDAAPSYCAGDANFGADVMHILAENERLRAALHEIVDWPKDCHSAGWDFYWIAAKALAPGAHEQKSDT